MEASDQPYRKEGAVPTEYEDRWASGPAGLDVSGKNKITSLRRREPCSSSSYPLVISVMFILLGLPDFYINYLTVLY